jgi:hypothetical protein
MGFFADFKRNRRRSKGWDEAHRFKRAGQFAEAAGVYERLAADSLQYNELIYEGDCHDAFKFWLKAMNVDNALTQARNALRVISDSNWLRMSSETVDDLCKMVGELYVAGYATAADTFLREINEQLVAHDLPPRSEVKHGKFPTTCPQCAGTLPSTYSDESLTCPFCGCVIRAQ